MDPELEVNSAPVTKRPLAFLRLDGLVLLIPDIFMLGYAHSNRLGALIYNIGHSYALPAPTALYGWRSSHTLVLAVGLIWFAHIGMDRAAGFGLKYDEDFKFTHLGSL